MSIDMAKRPANPNTAYGRKRLRDEYYQHKASLSPEERANQNTNEVIIYIIIVAIVAFIVFLIGGSGAALKWFTQ
jgi:Co/Zn/Cd efflux system component